MTNHSVHIDPHAPHWYAVRTKYKTEKLVCDNLTKKGIEAYIPLLKQTKRYNRKVVHRKIPLIHCYVFVKISEAQKVTVLQSEYVFSFLSLGGKKVPIPEQEIDLMKRVVGEFEGKISASPAQWETGSTVEVISGSLTGMKGRLIGKAGKKQFVVELTSLAYELNIEIDQNMLRLVKKAA